MMALETLVLELVSRQSRLIVSRIGVGVVATSHQLLRMVIAVHYSGGVLLSADELRRVLSAHQEFCSLLSAWLGLSLIRGWPALTGRGKGLVHLSTVIWSEA